MSKAPKNMIQTSNSLDLLYPTHYVDAKGIQVQLMMRL